MPEKRSKYDTDPLDPDFVRRTEEMSGKTGEVGGEQQTVPLRDDPSLSEPTRRFDEQVSDSYPSVFVPPVYKAPPRPQAFGGFGVGSEPHQPPATAVPPGPSSPYNPQTPPPAAPSSRKVTKLRLSEKAATALPYAPFYIGLVIGIIWLLVVPRHETRTRFHAAQGLALQLAILVGSFIFGVVRGITDSGLGGFLFGLAAFVFLLVSMWRVWHGRPHHVPLLDDATAWLDDHFKPMK
ncbi:MAG TPA: hypothetical protein VN228_07535 [Pyrinomonadaceae bacterium]|nr:hypothetical protein [Pyrinomonadaceae bacterium]